MIFINIIWGMVAIKAAGNLVEDTGKLSSIWDGFEWDLSVRRAVQDEVLLKGLLDYKQEMNMVKIPAAACNYSQLVRAEHGGKIGFSMSCKCYLNSSSFDARFKRCMSNSELKRGCRYTTGSWQWLTKWTWEKPDDPVMILNYKKAQGITTALNANATKYKRCSVHSINYWKENMEWIEMNSIMNYSMPIFFKLNKIWHISWQTEHLSNKVKKTIQGKILKFAIDCEETESESTEEVLTFDSCLIFKVSGNLKFSSIFPFTKEFKPTEQIIPTEQITSTQVTDTTTVRTVLVATFASLGLILLVIIAVCYLQRRAKGSTPAVEEAMLNNKETFV